MCKILLHMLPFNFHYTTLSTELQQFHMTKTSKIPLQNTANLIFKKKEAFHYMKTVQSPDLCERRRYCCLAGQQNLPTNIDLMTGLTRIVSPSFRTAKLPASVATILSEIKRNEL